MFTNLCYLFDNLIINVCDFPFLFKGLQKDIEDAEKVLDSIEAGDKLKDAMSRRHLGDVEAGVSNIKKKKLEKDYAIELIDADRLINKLKRLERLRKEILELNQSTISEIRSYQKPPPAVHQIMIAVYLLLNYREKELKVYLHPFYSELRKYFNLRLAAYNSKVLS